MAFDSQDRLYITDEQLHRITVFDTDGAFLGKWGEFGDGDGQINGPSGIDFDSEDNAYVVDQHNHRIHKFTRDGEHLLQWGVFGQAEGQFNQPWGVEVDSHDNVYVADWRNDRIQKFTPDGEFLAQFGESGNDDGQFNRPADVAVDSEGYVYVADWGNERVQLLAADGAFADMQRGQATLSKWTEDFFESNRDERDTRAIANMYPTLPEHLSDPYHASSQTEPFFWEPVSVHVDAEDRLYVTESRRHRFQVYQRA
jgi:DNA-binding beta-propeller fold protein YncE